MRIKPITLVGIALIVLGIVAFAYQGITYTSRETVIDIGPIHATATPRRPSRSPLYWAGWRLQAGSSWSWLEPRNRLSATGGRLPRATS
jgi:hypothetical protein